VSSCALPGPNVPRSARWTRTAVVEIGGDEPAAVVNLFRGSYFVLGDGSMGRHYDLAPDGRFLMLKDTHDASANPSHFVVVQNWIGEVERLTMNRPAER
jgi:hypothetical protein